MRATKIAHWNARMRGGIVVQMAFFSQPIGRRCKRSNAV
jgi:hypothetical protein